MPWPAFDQLDLYASAIRTVGSVILALRPDHTVCFWNAEAERLYGLTRDEALGLDYVRTFIAPEQQHLIAADIRKVLAGEPTWNFEDDSVLASGERRTLIWNVQRFTNAAAEVCGIVACGYDITARKDAERTLRLVWDRSTEGLLIGGGPGIVDCNPAALAMLGLAHRAELIGQHPLVFSPARQPDGELSADKARRLDTITRERGEHRFEWWHRRRDGTPVPTAVHVRMVELDGRERTVIAWHDLSEQHATAAREAALREQLARSQKLDALGHLAGGVAHDFNNLLTAIRGSLDLALLDLPANSPAATELQLAQETTARAGALVRQLLAFARHRESSPTTFDLAELIRETQSLWRRLLPPELTLRVTVPDTAVPVRGDASQLEQVCLNLLVNARDAMPTGGEVRVSLRVDAGEPTARVHLDVADTGVGMSPAVRDRVFDPFFTTKPLGEGTGIGLAVVYGVISAHEGTVDIESAVGEGTTVRITLPLAVDPAWRPDEGLTTTSELPVPVTRLGGNGRSVLLVDDEPAVRGALARVLRRAGFDVIEATHGAEALTRWHADSSHVSVVLSDVRMPVMDGPEFVRHLRAAGGRTPVLLMSGFADEDLVRGLPPDVARVLSKPFSSEALLTALRDTMDAAPSPRAVS